jgi:hypothetical protein
VHAHGGGDVTRAGGSKTLHPKQTRGSREQGLAAIAIVAFLFRLAGTATRSL